MSVYVELHCHSSYSLREGASTPVELLDRAAALGYDTLALTDHDGLYGAMEFAREANLRGIRPITGAEITLSNGHHLTLLAESQRGYANLCRLISAAHGTPLDASSGEASVDHTPHVALDVAYLERAALDGLIALSGCSKGETPALVQAGRFEEAEAATRRYREWFGRDTFFIELQQNFVYGDTARNAALVELAERVGVGTVATNNVHYHVRERSRLHDVLVAIRNRTTLDASHRLRRANAEFYLKSPARMEALFRRYPKAVRTSRAIAERCAEGFNLPKDLGYTFPDYAVPPGHDTNSYLRRLCEEALERKRGLFEGERHEQAQQRLEEELRLIAMHGLAGFFLTYRDILTLAGEVAHELHGRDPNLPTDERPVGRGRGSSVSSLVCYLIGLSHVDPLRHNLFLGRFLNEAMVSVPDIDLDFPRDIRARLIERMYERYPNHVGLVCILPTYRLRSAIRDVGKVLGLPALELDKLAKLSEGWARANTLAEEMARIPEFAGRVNMPVWRDLIDLSGQLAGFPRHVSQHVGGMVLSSRPISEVVPVEPARMSGRFLIQWDKDSADDARFVKIDFLALGMLSLVNECLDTIEERYGRRVDFSRSGYDDEQVYDQICAADTVGLFQIESRAQMQTLPHTRPRNLDDLAVEVAIVRPGPIVGGAFRPYMEYRRRQLAGEELGIEWDHDLLRPVLQETLGVILFQDQVLEVAMAIAGYTAGQAESLRRSMSRKRSFEAMASHWPSFRDGALGRGVPEEKALHIFEKLLGFAEFGFPKSHAVAFARLAYESAWLRRYYPVEYYCALFNNQPMGFYQPGVLVGDARRHGIDVLSPDINRGGVRCTVETDTAFRLGFSSVREISVAAAEGIVAEQRRGPFRSLFDFVQRTGLHRAGIENLIRANAFEETGLERRELMWQLGLFAGVSGRRRGETAPDATRGRQLALPLPINSDMATLPPMSDWERMASDYYALDYSPSMHPLGILRRWLGERLHTSGHVERLPDGTEVQVAGLVVCRQRPHTAKGVLFLLLEDEFGMTNVVVHRRLYERQRLIVRSEPFVIVDGTLQRRGATVNVLARSFKPMRPPRDLVAPASRNFH
ncbi:MAG: error-prone DNA polymerase [Chloroflexi bacterium]|nr:error-prone DNA polymerase [Chloroflexota bacterium]